MSRALQHQLHTILQTATATLDLPLDGHHLERLAVELTPAIAALLAEADATVTELEPVPYEVTDLDGCTIYTGLDVDLDSPAARLALQLRMAQHDVTATDVPAPDILDLTVRPQSLDCWRWWLHRMGVPTDTLATVGNALTGTGTCEGVTVHLRGEGVPELLTDRGAARLIGLISERTTA
jgi:hypothetical protein